MLNWILTILISSGSISDSYVENTTIDSPVSDTVCLRLVVRDILSTDSFYIIHAGSDDKVVRIISKKPAGGKNKRKIRVGRKYTFNLVPFYRSVDTANPLTGFNSTDPCYYISEQTLICSEKDVYGPYTALNLSGLYLNKVSKNGP